MKLLISALLFLPGFAGASDCLWDDCEIVPMARKTDLQKPVALPIEIDVVKVIETPTVAAHAVSIKPAVPDDRPPLFDGGGKTRNFDKTVDWRDGVPIWDDSISDYTKTDFSDWFIESAPFVIIETEPSPMTNTIADINERIEELLIPSKPTENLWTNDKYTPQDMTVAVMETFGTIESDDGCPFDSDWECEIWRKKPMVRETVSPRSPKLRAINMNMFTSVANANPNITANDAAAAPFLDRYKLLMKSARACCADGMVYKLRQAGASDGLVYKFMSDDANFYNIGNRCLMTSDAELDKNFPNTATSATIADVRNGCLCRGRQWFGAMLAPFQDAWKASPEFANAKFDYTYTDGLQREITVSVNNDVKNVLNQLELCP